MDEHLSDEAYLQKYRGTLQVASAPHAAAGIGTTPMRDATDEELLARRGRREPTMMSTLITDKSKMSGGERILRTLLALRVAGAGLYTDDGELSDGTVHPGIDFLRDDPETIEAKLRLRGENSLRDQYAGVEAIIDYTNWRGEHRIRRIKPIRMHFGSTEWHKEEQWLLKAVDLEDNKEKDFAFKDIHMFSGTLGWILQKSEVPS